MKRTKNVKSTVKPAAPKAPQALTVDLLRAVVGGTVAREESRK